MHPKFYGNRTLVESPSQNVMLGRTLQLYVVDSYGRGGHWQEGTVVQNSTIIFTLQMSKLRYGENFPRLPPLFPIEWYIT